MEKLDLLSTAIDKDFKTEPPKENWIHDSKKEQLEKHKQERIKYKIDVKEVLPPPQIAWSMLNTKSEGEAILGTLGDFGLIIGKAKSRKSFFINIAVSTALSKDLIF